MKSKTLTLKNGRWIEAEQIPYYPNIWEKIGHFFGKHYPYENDHCLLCGKEISK